MKVLLLSDPGSIHTIRWARALSEKSIDLYVYGFSSFNKNDYEGYPITVRSENFGSGMIDKLRYVSVLGKVKKIIRQFKPDIVHAHYASSYGLIGALTGFKPLIISVWGTDVFDFPKRSVFFRFILQKNLAAASRIFSTSIVMAKETQQYIDKSRTVDITPFGIDLDRFSPKKSLMERRGITIGTVKTLSLNYGIDVLIQAFSILSRKYPQQGLKLVIGGDGADKTYFQSLVNELGLQKSVEFLGKIVHDKVPDVLNNLDIFAALSDNESFGVAVIEASACELPVVVTDVGGLPEVVEENVTGLIVPKRNAQAAAAAFEKLLLNPTLRKNMGRAGRERVWRYYHWDRNVEAVVRLYNEVLKLN